jgi:TPR repeat protein
MARVDMGGIDLKANAGTPDALFELGIFYSTGLSVEADLVVAHKWFNLAAIRGNRAALERRKELSAEMTAAQIAEAQRLAREWLAAEKGAGEWFASTHNAIETLAGELATREETHTGAVILRPAVWHKDRSLAA